MVYQQCGPVCPQTCDTLEDEDCSNGCIEGCFCPSGKVLFHGNCINATKCAGKHTCMLYKNKIFKYSLGTY